MGNPFVRFAVHSRQIFSKPQIFSLMMRVTHEGKMAGARIFNCAVQVQSAPSRNGRVYIISGNGAKELHAKCMDFGVAVEPFEAAQFLLRESSLSESALFTKILRENLAKATAETERC